MQASLSLLGQGLVLQSEPCPGSRVFGATHAFLAGIHGMNFIMKVIHWPQDFIVIAADEVCQNI